MNKAEIMNNFSRKFHRVGFKLKKHSPEILIVAGVIGTVASTVLACKATLKVNEVIDEAKETLDEIHVSAEKGFNPNGRAYPVEDAKKDTAVVYAQTGLKLAKLYGPSVIIGVTSLSMILTSHNILRKRNLALAAAYATEMAGFKDYRNRVIERFGKDLDKELRYNIKAEEMEEIVKDENGNETTVKTTVEVPHPNLPGIYARCFDETCPNWVKNAEDNLFFLIQQQNHANEKLREKGYLFLNDVYEMLGFQATQTGQIVGWVYDEKNPIGDNFIDFGIHDLHDKCKRRFVNGYERSIWVDFNVDGDVASLLP